MEEHNNMKITQFTDEESYKNRVSLKVQEHEKNVLENTESSILPGYEKLTSNSGVGDFRRYARPKFTVPLNANNLQ